MINERLALEQRLASLFEGGAPVRTLGRRECRIDVKTLPQSKIGSEKPIFDSPLREGAKATVLR